MRRGTRLILFGAVAVAAIVVLVLIFAFRGSGKSQAGTATATSTATPSGWDFKGWSIDQSGQPHNFPPDKLGGTVQCSWEAGVPAKIQFVFNKIDAEVVLVQNKGSNDPKEHEDKDNTNLNGVAEFDLDTTLAAGQTYGNKDYELRFDAQTRDFTLVFSPQSGGGGSATTNHINCVDELMGTLVSPTAVPSSTPVEATATPGGEPPTATSTTTPPITVGVVFDPRVRVVFIESCGFKPEDATPHFDEAPEDIKQVAVDKMGNIFEALHPIPKGQHAFFLVENAELHRKCAVNPVCGNPQPLVPKPIAPPQLETPPPGKEVPPSTATPTSPPGSPPSPSATNTPRVPTSTPVPPTATPPAPTQTAAPPQKSCCTPVSDYTRPAVINTPVNTIPVPPNTPQPIQTTRPDPVGPTHTPVGGGGCGLFC